MFLLRFLICILGCFVNGCKIHITKFTISKYTIKWVLAHSRRCAPTTAISFETTAVSHTHFPAPAPPRQSAFCPRTRPTRTFQNHACAAPSAPCSVSAARGPAAHGPLPGVRTRGLLSVHRLMDMCVVSTWGLVDSGLMEEWEAAVHGGQTPGLSLCLFFIFADIDHF